MVSEGCQSNLGRLPDLPGEAKGVHVAVGADPREPVEVPGAPEVGPPLQDNIARPLAVLLSKPYSILLLVANVNAKL